MKICTNFLVATRAPCAMPSSGMMPLSFHTKRLLIRFVWHCQDRIGNGSFPNIILRSLKSTVIQMFVVRRRRKNLNDKGICCSSQEKTQREWSSCNVHYLWSAVRAEELSAIARRNQLRPIGHAELFGVRRRMCERNCAQRTHANEPRDYFDRRRLH